jgi:hypothetical protein
MVAMFAIRWLMAWFSVMGLSEEVSSDISWTATGLDL